MRLKKIVPRSLTIGCSAIALFALGVTGAMAQQERGDAGSKGGATEQQAPAGDVKRVPGAKNTQSQSSQGDQPSAKRAPDAGTKANRAASDDAKKAEPKASGDAGKRAADSKEMKDQKQKGESGRRVTDTKEKDDAKAKRGSKEAAQPNDQSGRKQSGSEKSQTPPTTGQAQTKEGASPPAGASTPSSAQQQQTAPKQQTGEQNTGNVPRQAKLDDSQRGQFRQTILAQRDAPRLNRPNFTISIGTRVPRDVRLLAIPAALILIAPAYRDYRYVVVEERIVIIEPTTYEIIEVIDEGQGPAQARREQRASLELSQGQRQIVLRLVRPDAPRANVNIGLALGAEIPQNVELLEFSPEITTEVSQLREYRYVLVQDNMAIVNPSNRVVVLVVRNQ